MRYRKGLVLCLLVLAQLLPIVGCNFKKKQDLGDQVSQKLADLQRRVLQSGMQQARTDTPNTEIKPAWENFTLTTREIFKPFEAAELSDTKAVADAYKIQLKGVVSIGRPKAIIVVDNKSYMVAAGDRFLDIVVHQVTENGVEVQRSYKRVQLSVGEATDI